MVYEIVWTFKAINSYAQNMEYLQNNWTEREIRNFIAAVEIRLEILALQPLIGAPQSKRNKNIRQTIINKRISLIYRVKPRKKQIELILFWNTYQNPVRLKSATM